MLGSFYMSVQVMKQRSIEKQVQMKIDQETSERIAKDLKDEQDRIDTAREESLKQVSIDICFQDAISDYNMTWESECKTRSLKENCSLPMYAVDNFDGRLKEQKANCLKRYNK